jgi:nucleotide-binding universal stress UspA family protein
MAIMSIVVGVDGSESSLHALSFSIGLAIQEDARVMACFVARHPHHMYDLGVGITPLDYESYAGELERLVTEEFERADVSGSFFYREGAIVHELKRLADERGANLIAVGRSRHPLLNVASIPRRLLENSRHLVLVVP